jgi:hypothetical protein
VASFNITEYRQAIAGTVFGVVLAILGVVSPIGGNFVRPDAFTGTDAASMRADMMEEIHRLDTLQQTLLFRAVMCEDANKDATRLINDHLRRHQ